MTSPSEVQTAIVQVLANTAVASGVLPLELSHTVPVPGLPSPEHVLVRVHAVALNPTDHKLVTHFTSPGGMVGCDFSGVVVDVGSAVAETMKPGTRVCGGVFPYGNGDDSEGLRSGAFSQWLVTDARLLLRLPDSWNDTEGAALGGVGWGTVGLALSDPDALGLEGVPSRPVRVGDEKTEAREPVLVYGGATATGTMACQLLKLSGYSPIAVTSPESAALALRYGAAATAHYTSPDCAQDIRARSTQPSVPVRHVVDCITSQESVATCLAAMARTGGRYAALEHVPKAWRTRKAVRVREVMGYEGLGRRVSIGVNTPGDGSLADDERAPGSTGENSSTYTREPNPALFAITHRWRDEVQALLDEGLLRCHPVREVSDGDDWASAIVQGLSELQRGEVRGQKLVVRVPH